MQNLWNKVSGYKTYTVAIATIIYGLVYYGFSQHDWSTAVSLVLGSAGLGALRHGVAKS